MKGHSLASLIRGAAFVFTCRVIGAVLTFVAQVVLARMMGADQFGAYVFAFSICVLLTSLSGLGFPAAGIRFLASGAAQGRDDLVLGFARRAYQVFATVGLAIAVVGALLVWSIDGLVPNERRPAVLMAFMLVPLYGQLVSRSAVALGLSWPQQAFLPNLVFRPLIFLLLLAGASLFSIKLNAQYAMGFQLSAIVLVMLVLAWVMRVKLNTRFPAESPAYETRSWLHTAMPLLVITLFINYFMELNLFLAGINLSSGDLAVFNASFRTAALVMFGLYAVDAITMPRISRLYAVSDDKAFRTLITRASRLRFWGALVASVVLLAIGKPVLSLFGETFIAGYQALLILAASQVVGAAFGPTAQLLSITGLQYKCLPVFALSLIAMLVLHPLLIQQFGINGAAVAVFAVVLIQSVWLYALVVKHLGVHAWALTFSRAGD